MRALQLDQPRSLVAVNAPVPNPGRDQILVRTEWISICGSDIPFFNGTKYHTIYPLEPGAYVHECVGQVKESISDRFRPGDRVMSIPEGNRGMAEFFISNASKAVLLPEGLPHYGSSCLVQPLATVMNAIDQLTITQGQNIAIIGLGSIGLLFGWLVSKQGAEKVIGIDPNEDRCRAAADWGFSTTYSMRGVEFAQLVKDSSIDWEPPEICIEAVGHQVETLNDCIKLVNKKGTVLAFGVPDQPVYPIEFEIFFRKNARLTAVVTPEWTEYLVKAKDLFLSHQAKLETLITHQLPIVDAGKAFSLYESHQDGILKVLLDATDWD